MATVDEGLEAESAPKKKSPVLFVLLVVTAMVAGLAAGYFGKSLGFIPDLPFLSEQTEATEKPKTPGMPDVVFVEIPTLTVSLPPDAQARNLRFSAFVEVPTEYEEDVRALMPRILDLLNGYLRALDSPDIEGPAALLKLRAQMLRRIVLVVGEGRANDLLVSEFVLN